MTLRKPARLCAALGNRETLERLHSNWLMCVIAIGLELHVSPVTMGITIMVAIAIRDHMITLLALDLERGVERVREELTGDQPQLQTEVARR